MSDTASIVDSPEVKFGLIRARIRQVRTDAELLVLEDTEEHSAGIKLSRLYAEALDDIYGMIKIR